LSWRRSGPARQAEEDDTAITSEQGNNVTLNLRGGLLAGLISSVIWMMISTAVAMGKGPVIIGGLIFLIGTWLIATAISTFMARSKSDRSVSPAG
jgi:hypothetical protein